jgi:hypothetical protein
MVHCLSHPPVGLIASLTPALHSLPPFLPSSPPGFSPPPQIVWLPIGLTFMARGFVVRIAVHANPWKITTYAISNLFILLSPCAFLACCYQLLGLMANSLGPDTVAAHCLLIRTSRITKILYFPLCSSARPGLLLTLRRSSIHLVSVAISSRYGSWVEGRGCRW